ncbi:hypothetical protein GE09DRAFT_206713 [Coniochaeta sp. 2T2.1]|nr:hypothetical protein GE09DRAFT_206713 [Coniochaeta sp. 2T2.1]
MEAWELIEDYLPLEIRTPRGGGGKGGKGKGGKGKSDKGKSGSGSSSSSGSSSGSSGGSSSKSGSGSSSKSSGGGTTVVVVGSGTGYHHHGGGGYIGNLPTWAVVLIIWASLIVTLFLCALLYYILKERKRSKQEGQSPRIKHALWKATKAALLIWLATKIWKSCCARGRHKKGGAKAGTYAKIDEDSQQGGGDIWYGSSTTPAVTDSATAYGAGGKGSASPAEGRYEPFSYQGASCVHAAPPGPDMGPPPVSSTSSPPPDSGTTTATTPPTTATAGSYPTEPATSTAGGGEAQSYYASMGISDAYAPSISSTYEPSVLSSAPTPSPAYQAAYHPPVSPEPPSAAYPPPPMSPPAAQYPAYPAQATYVPYTSPGPRYGGS